MKDKLLFYALFFYSFFAQAQGPEPHTFGQVQHSDFDIKFEPDPETEAIVLQHSVAHRFAYRKDADALSLSGYKAKISLYPNLFSATFIRIKIQKKSALDEGNFVLPYYFDPKEKDYKEGYDVVEGYTYNLRGNTIEKTALAQENIADIKIKEDMGELRITMPKVEEGSIIELRYIRNSPYSRFIEPWEFQGTYPTLFSQFHAQFSSVDFTIAARNHNRPYAPKSFVEKNSTLRSRKDKNKYPEESNIAYYLRTNMNAEHKTIGKITRRVLEGRVMYSDQWGNNLRVLTNPVIQEYDTLVLNTLAWEAQNVPAFKEEAYMTAMRDHVMSLDFAYVAKATIEGGFSVDVVTWEQINHQFLKRYNFEHSLNLRNSAVNEAAHEVADKRNTPLQKVQAMATYVKNRVALENKHGIDDKKRTAKEAFTEKKGNLMQMNLLLVAMLQDIKIEAYPVLLSTRSNGTLYDEFPDIKMLNYVLTEVIIDGKSYLIDLSEKYAPVGILSDEAYNRQAWRVHDSKQGWIKVGEEAKSTETTLCNLTLTEDGIFEGDIQELYKEQAAFDRRRVINNQVEQYKANLMKDVTIGQLSNIEIKDLKEIELPLTIKYHLKTNKQADQASNLLYFSPMLSFGITENVFKSPEREYPADFPYQIDFSYILNLTIPANYVVEELPKSLNYYLPNKDAGFRFGIVQNELGKLQITSKITIRKTLFTPEEYPELKKLYDQIVNKHAEQIVIKKVK